MRAAFHLAGTGSAAAGRLSVGEGRGGQKIGKASLGRANRRLPISLVVWLVPLGSPPHRLGLCLSASALPVSGSGGSCEPASPSNGLSAVHGASAHQAPRAWPPSGPRAFPTFPRRSARARDPDVCSTCLAEPSALSRPRCSAKNRRASSAGISSCVEIGDNGRKVGRVSAQLSSLNLSRSRQT